MAEYHILGVGSMVDVAPLLPLLNSLPRAGASVSDIREIDLALLAGDASNRTYYRVTWTEGELLKSLVLMVLADPEPFKASEEAVTGPHPPVTELPFINIQRHLHACQVAVPEIFHYSPKKGWLLLEDLGDALLAHEIMKVSTKGETVFSLYQKAIDELIRMQRFATPVTTPPTLAHYRAFDPSLFIWEFDHFIEYGLEKREGLTLPDKEKRAIRAYFSDMALQLATLPLVFTHRDYHSRNLMVQQNDASPCKIRVIDFQDALMGPCQYDLASLLRDSYIALPEGVIDRLILYYLSQWEEQTNEKTDKEQFRVLFDLISLQRNLKAAGRFVYIDQVKKNPNFLPYVAPTLANVKKNLTKHKRLKPLYDLLSKYVKELQ